MFIAAFAAYVGYLIVFTAIALGLYFGFRAINFI